MTVPIRTIKTRDLQVNPDINWYRYRSCVRCPSVISNQINRILSKFSLNRVELINFLLKNGLIYLKNQKKDQESIISECFETRKLKYLQDVEIFYYKDKLNDDFFTIGNELVSQGATFSGFTNLCLKYGLIWLREVGVDNYLLNLDIISFLTMRRRIRDKRRIIDIERIKNPDIDLSTIGLFE